MTIGNVATRPRLSVTSERSGSGDVRERHRHPDTRSGRVQRVKNNTFTTFQDLSRPG